jgi:uncharacterized protein
MIDLTLERHGDYHFVRSVGSAGVRVGGTTYPGSLILTAEQVLTDWPPSSFTDVRLEHLEVLFALKPEVALLGTGEKHAVLDRGLLTEVYRRGIGLEVMTTDAACRTFNILVAEGRNVAAGLLPMHKP